MQQQGPISFHMRGREDRDSDDDSDIDKGDIDNGAARQAILPILPRRGQLTRTAARQLKTEQLADELRSRNASTAGLKPARLQRLLHLLNVEVEEGYTKGDVDEYNGVHPITLQCDSAKPHVGNDNINRLNERGAEKGFHIDCGLQPQKSPDLKKNDMSFNNSLAIQASKIANVRSESYEGIVCNVVRAFEDYPVDAIYRAYAETFAVYREILKNFGGNDFKMPHGEVRKNESRGLEIVDYFVEVAVVEGARKWLAEHPLPNPG